jgi:hypothetical protein
MAWAATLSSVSSRWFSQPALVSREGKILSPFSRANCLIVWLSRLERLPQASRKTHCAATTSSACALAWSEAQEVGSYGT